MIPYYIEVFADPTDQRTEWLSEAIAQELNGLGVTRTLSVECIKEPAPDDTNPSVCLYFAKYSFSLATELERYVKSSLTQGRLVIPIVADLTGFTSLVPEYMRALNGFAFSERKDAERLSRILLEELGIEDKQRRAFISHRREDGLAAAEQLHDHLSQIGFHPFIDRFHIRPGSDVQAQIADQLEDCALLVLLETPAAHTSPWVFDEVDYALSHFLGMKILTWPGEVSQLPGTPSLPRHILSADDLIPYKGYDVFTSDALDRILVEIEAEHARAMVRRRRYLLVSVEESAVESGRQCNMLPGWRLEVTDNTGTSIVQVTPRLPAVDDLFSLDRARVEHNNAADGVLVHAARRLSRDRRSLLAWAGEFRNLTLVPENVIGMFWEPDGT